MIKLSNIHRALIVLLLSTLSVFSIRPGSADAHTPHDVIDAVVISPNYYEDQTVFIVVKNDWVFKSENGGLKWKALKNGIDNKFTLTSLAISPSFQVDHTLFLSSSGDGLYKSEDGGASWYRSNHGLLNLRIDSLIISPNFQNDKSVLAIASDGTLYLSTSEGKNWNPIIHKNKKITSAAFLPDQPDLQVVLGDNEGNLYFSSADGKLRPLSPIHGHGAITSMAISPEFSTDGTFFVGTENGGIFKTNNAGGLFFEVNKGISCKNIISLVVSPNYGGDTTIFASTWHEAVFISKDGGDIWKKFDKGLSTDRQADAEDEFKSPQFRDIRISKTYNKDGTIFLGGFDGLFKSLNGGQSWKQLDTMSPTTIRGLALSPPNKEDITIAATTYGGGAYISEDMGSHWSVNNLGLRSTRLEDIAFSPNYVLDNKIYTTSLHFFLISKDKGTHWDRIRLRNKSLQARIYSWLKGLGFSRERLEKIVFHRTRILEVWAHIIAISPGFTSDNTIFLGSRYHGIFKSIDGGLTFSNVWDNADRMDLKKVTSLILSPSFVSDQTLYAGVRYEGILKSINGGKTWQKINNGIIFAKEDKSLLRPYYYVAISPVFQTDHTLFLGNENGLFKTKDGGAKWEKLNIIPHYENTYINAIAISPNYPNDKTLIISLKGRGLFKTRDRGETWFEIGADLKRNNHAVNFIKFPSNYPQDNIILSASREYVFKSKDGGEGWEIIGIPLVRYEDNWDPLQYEGEWKIKSGEDFSATSIHYSNNAGSKAILNFVGTGVSWLGTKSKEQGIARLYIDGDFKANVDQFSHESKVRVNSYSINDLPYGSHSITIEVAGEKNPNSSGFKIEIDSIDVME